jgi:hypothetical protein
MRRAKLEGRQIGRRPIDVDRPGIFRDRNRGLSLTAQNLADHRPGYAMGASDLPNRC